MNGSDITVVIPTYRRPELLSRALLSVLRQEVSGVRIHVFDNASGDDTARVVRALAERQPIAYTCHEENLGFSANFRIAIASIETPYCCILNDDDMQLPGLLASALEALPAHPAAGAFCGRTLAYAPARGGGKLSARVGSTTWEPGIYRAGESTSHMVRDHFTPTAVVFSTAALRGARFELGDMEMMARVAERHDLVVSDRILGVYVLHPDAWSSSRSLDDVRRTHLRRLKEYLELETLDSEERQEAVLLCLTELMTAQYWHALSATLGGERTSPLRRDLAQSAWMLRALTGARSSAGERWYHRVVAYLAGRSEAPLSRAAVLALRASRIIRAIDHLTQRPRPRTAAEDAALAEIAALDRSTEEFLRGLRSERSG